jgi:hypothetical protein
MSIPNYHIYLKLMVGGAVSRPFSAETLEITGDGLKYAHYGNAGALIVFTIRREPKSRKTFA